MLPRGPIGGRWNVRQQTGVALGSSVGGSVGGSVEGRVGSVVGCVVSVGADGGLRRGFLVRLGPIDGASLASATAAPDAAHCRMGGANRSIQGRRSRTP